MNMVFDESGNSPNSIINHLSVYGSMLLLNKRISKFSDIYCGITNSLDATLTRHKIQKYLCVIDCGSMEKAAYIETVMGDLGYDIGNPPHDANGAANDSRYVYLFVKTTNSDPALKIGD